jgi:hypothetical protein
MRLRPVCLLLAMSAVLPACGQPWQPIGPIEKACTLESRASVVVTVVDTKGTVQRDARVTFTLDGGPEQQALCNGSLSGTPPPCDRWVPTYEQGGQYVITATSADGSSTAQARVTVREDECHVQTETVQLTLPD